MFLSRARRGVYNRFKRMLLFISGNHYVSGSRIFGIGFSKTGTTTLGQCFDILGFYPNAYSPTAPHINLKFLCQEIFEHGNYGPALNAAIRFRTLQDRPWNVWNMYKILDAAFPESKFILTYRDPESWWKSVDQWLNVTHKNNGAKLERYLKQLKVDRVDTDMFISSYLQYNEEVKSYFGNRSDFLIVNFEESDGWVKLCNFLDLPVPDVPFPHAKKQIYDRS